MDVLPDVLADGLITVFCGSAAGAASARRGAYYAGPGNAFWPTLHAVGFTPYPLQPPAFRSVIRYGIGLTDLAKSVAGSDASLRSEHFDSDGLRVKILRYRPAILAFTSKRAAREFLGQHADYGLQSERVGGTSVFVLPSPSGAARRYWDQTPWRQLAQLHAERLPKQRLPNRYAASDSGE
jgi:TDG/mug DNA glycosylase family protein